MSLSFLDRPQDITPAYNDMMHVVKTTNAAATNFFVKAKVYYHDDTDYVQIGKDYNIFCVPNTDYILFSPDRILRNYVTDDIDILMGSTTTGQASRIGEQYQIKFQEWMGNTPQASGTELSQVNYVFHGALERKEFANYSMNDYVINNSQLARFLTPVDEVWLKDTDTYMLTCMAITTGSSAVLSKLRVQKFDYSNSSLGITDVSMLSPESAYQNKFQSVRIGPAQVGAASNVKYYDVWAANSLNTQKTQKFRVYIDRTCSQYETHSVYFLNRYGGIDMLNFPLVSREQITIDKSLYNRPVGDVSEGLWSLNTYDRERSVFDTKITHRNVYNSGYLDDTQAILFKELVTSPKIWVYNGEWISMFVERNDYEVKKLINDGLIQEELILIESLTSARQR